MDWVTFDALRRARAKGETGLRFYPSVWAKDWAKLAGIIRREGRGDDWVRWGIVKAMADGALGSRTAFMDKPFANDPRNSGLLIQPVAEMQAWCEGADRAGLQVEVHAIGDRANAELLGIFERVAKKNGPKDRRFRIEHAQHLRSGDVPRFAGLGVVASMQPYHAVDDGRWAEKRIGLERCRTTYAFRSLLKSGATLVFGSDWDVAPLSPLAGIDAAVNRRTLDGKNPEGWIPEQKIAVADALRAYTSSAAWAAFEETDKGTLTEGKLADFVVLSRDPLSIPKLELDSIKVEATVVGGKVVDSAAR
jgi:predicted amidohydrolase YtcJ